MRNRFLCKSNEIRTNSNLTMFLPLPPMPPLWGTPKAVSPGPKEEKTAGTLPIPSPGGRVAPEGGRERNSGGNL